MTPGPVGHARRGIGADPLGVFFWGLTTGLLIAGVMAMLILGR